MIEKPDFPNRHARRFATFAASSSVQGDQRPGEDESDTGT